MQMPAEAAVKFFEEADLGSLLVGRFRNEDPNFFAIRTELQESTGGATPYLVILSSWVDTQDRPYLCNPAFGQTRVLDLGRNWSVGVSIDESAPVFPGDSSRILVHTAAGFFIRLAKENFYLDLTQGRLIRNLDANGHEASWSEFAIYLAQTGMDGPGAEIFNWPRK